MRARTQLYLDHDAAGRQLVAYFQEKLPDALIEDGRSEIYAGHKDVNDYLISQSRGASRLTFPFSFSLKPIEEQERKMSRALRST